MADLIPIFPLKLVAYPDEVVPLHLFEERYKQLGRDLKNNKSGFGITPVIDDVIQDIGTFVRLKSINKEYVDGKMDIEVIGSKLFEISSLRQPHPGKSYKGANILWRSVQRSGNVSYNEEILEMLREIFQLLQIGRNLPESPRSFISFHIGHMLGLSLEQEYRLLSIRSEIDRQEFILDHLQKLLPVVQQMKSIRKQVNMNGQFRNLN